MMTRDEHLAWCKRRALEYLDRSDVTNAVTSMLSDLEKHSETKNNNKYLAVLGMMIIRDNDASSARRFIEGYN